ncbi:YifB family Mg chelatase-like AAA ATPase [Thermomicrobium roseum]|uniref:Putative Mg chelatase homolog n=1 Tax=Thermomicrobium roseum (strain ATCC 27502 / DSM 5159 / P-2) TaxID=309801 RepID=B9L590_THERP|nr:YifB family Mg chelatase-like AAA ATPase [Thermomicrobium roseum]ACM07141.1 putative Mg chelatase homolog [Thermomicrobium roseum DSM 5159]
MLACVHSSAVVGLEGVLVEVEVDIGPGNPGLTIVGLPDAAVQEARERVRAAIRNSGARFPLSGRITVNLAPADIRKEGPAYDLPIALGILLASGQVSADLTDTVVLGELSLDGTVRHTAGILPMVGIAREHGLRRAIVPAEDAAEAALVEGIEVIPVQSLNELLAHLDGQAPIAPLPPTPIELGDEPLSGIDFAEIKGQEHVKRGLELAAAGGHNVIAVGPPGAGKTLLARALPTILPPLTREEALEVTRIYSVAGLLPSGSPLIRHRPFRAPHHTISFAGMIGGGAWPRPGEVTLAHRGVLFLDELPEFSPRVLEVLRQPLEDRLVTISRASGAVTFPASFLLVAAMNPCPCGYHGDPVRACRCSPHEVARYQKRISGPLLDRIDIHLPVPRVEFDKLADHRTGEPSAAVRARVEAARAVQQLRFGDSRRLNSEMTPAEIRRYCRLDEAGERLLRTAVERLGLSARGYHRVLKLARTIADLAGAERIAAVHVAEALQYRPQEVG